MTVVHIVLFKFLPTTTASQKSTLTSEVKKLKTLPYVKDHRLIVGGPSISQPQSASAGFEIALVSFHESREMLERYQGCVEHHHFVEAFLKPIREQSVRFDFEVDEVDESMVGVLPMFGSLMGGSN